MIDVVSKYGLDMSGGTDNAAKLTQLASDVAAWRGPGFPGKPLPRLVFSEGDLFFSEWPDLAYDGLQIVAEGECRLHYTGSGDGIVFDASKRNPSATQPGISNFTFDGFDVWAQPSGSPLWFKGIHRSRIAARVITANGNATLRAACMVSFSIVTTFRITVSSNRQGPSCTGLMLDAWPGLPNLQTTTCFIETPCLEGCSTGLLIANAALCNVIGGTIENCGAAVALGTGAGNNYLFGVEMEGNGIDIQETSGSKNNRIYSSQSLRTNFGLFSSNKII